MILPRVLRIDPIAPDPSVIREAAAILTRGGLVAFPTETVYGLGARGLHADEVSRIFAAKRRPVGHPIILHVDGEEMAREVAGAWSSLASRFARELWPGPLTLVVPRGARVPSEVTGGLDTVGLRAPAHAVALALIRAVGEPLAAPSANAHTHVSPTMAEHVVRSLGDRVDLVLDAGPCKHGIESTVLAMGRGDGDGASGGDPTSRVLRPGAISVERLRAIDPSIHYDAMIAIAGDDEARASPGLAAKHYAPRARVVLMAKGGIDAAIAAELERSSKVAVIELASTPRPPLPPRDPHHRLHRISLPSDPDGYAHGLFAALHAIEEAGADVVIIEQVPTDSAWVAVADRLARAASRAP